MKGLLVVCVILFLFAAAEAESIDKPNLKISREQRALFQNFLSNSNPLNPVHNRAQFPARSEPLSLQDLPLNELNLSAEKRGFALRPLIIVPSLIGSVLMAQLHNAQTEYLWCLTNYDEWFYLYLDLTEFIPLLIDCFFERVAMRFDPADQRVHNATGVSVKMLDYGGLDGIEYLDADKSAGVWNTTANLLTELGYTRGLNLRGAPFDWRVSPLTWKDVQFPQLKALFEDTYLRNGNMSVAATSLSMGGPYFLAFLNSVSQEWKDKYVHSWTSMDGAFGGSTSALASLVNPSGIFGNWTSMFVTYADQWLSTLRTWPSIAYMMPFAEVFGDNSVFVTISGQRGRNYTASQYVELMKDAGGNLTALLFGNIEKGGMRTLAAPGVPVHCVFGYNVSTPHVLNYPSSLSQVPTYTLSDGDGTVLHQGLDRCAVWSKQQKQIAVSHPVANMFHGTSIQNPSVLAYFIHVLFN